MGKEENREALGREGGTEHYNPTCEQRNRSLTLGFKRIVLASEGAHVKLRAVMESINNPGRMLGERGQDGANWESLGSASQPVCLVATQGSPIDTALYIGYSCSSS